MLFDGTLFGAINVETPKFEIISKGSNFEVRKYQQQIQAQTTYDKSINSGFWNLANYIFGRSQAARQAKVAMTAPVLTGKVQPIAMTAPVLTRNESDANYMAFVMPSQYKGIEELPEPSDPNVKLTIIPEQTYAVKKFSGWVSPQKSKEEAENLRQMVSKEMPNLQLEEDEQQNRTAQYNDPFVIPWLRTNEVWIPVKSIK